MSDRDQKLVSDLERVKRIKRDIEAAISEGDLVEAASLKDYADKLNNRIWLTLNQERCESEFGFHYC